MTGRRPDVSICVATCDRRDGLKRLFDSFDAMEIPVECSVEILVVDNAPGAGTTDALRGRNGSRFTVRWLEEPERNISMARNRALDEACGRWLAFIDDDEIAEPRWLAAHWSAAQTGTADGWFGPVIPKLDRIVTPWLDTESFFSRPRHASGTSVPGDELRTGNAFLRRELFDGVRFDPAFGLSGGGDQILFARMQRSGARFSWCDAAAVTERVSPDRHRLSWLARRAFRGGVVFTRFTQNAGGPTSLLRTVPRPLASICALFLALPAAALCGRRTAARVWLRVCTQAGHLWACAGRNYEPYAPRDGSGACPAGVQMSPATVELKEYVLTTPRPSKRTTRSRVIPSPKSEYR